MVEVATLDPEGFSSPGTRQLIPTCFHGFSVPLSGGMGFSGGALPTRSSERPIHVPMLLHPRSKNSAKMAFLEGFTYNTDECDKEWLNKNNEEAFRESTSIQGAASVSTSFSLNSHGRCSNRTLGEGSLCQLPDETVGE
jgi:hypothetical protein